MALHRKVNKPIGPEHVEEGSKHRSVIDPIFARAGEAAGAPTHVMPLDGMRPDTAYQVVHDELMLDGNARLNLATFVTTWMEPQAETAHVRDVRQEHDRQGRVPAHRGPRDALRQHAGRLWNSPGRGRGDRDLDDRLERGGDARRHGAQVALARAHAAAGQADRQAQHGDGHQRPGVLGEVLPLLGRRDAAGADGGRPVQPQRRGGGQALRREHDRGRPDPRAPRSTAATSRSRRSARPSTSSRPTPGSTSRCTSTAPRARSSRRSSTRTWCGTSGSTGCSRSTPPGTSTGWCTPGSAGSCGATPRRFPTTSCSR